MSVISGIVSADAARSAANTQADATASASATQLATSREAIAAQKEMSANALAEQKAAREQARADLEPWRTSGVNALADLVAKINAGPGEFTTSPGYDFRVAEGTKALERGASARGNLLGGAETKALTRFGQDYATGDYDNFLRRYYESLTPLQSVAGVGESSAAQTAGLGSNISNAIAQNYLNTGQGISNTLTTTGQQIGANTIVGGNALAGGDINSANAITGAMRSGTSNALLAYDLWKRYGAAKETIPEVVKWIAYE